MEDFLEDLKNDHKDFDLAKIEEILGNDPFVVFEQWMKNAIEQKQTEANACVISTVNEKGQPSARVVYLKELVNDQFVFYTNYSSQKGQEIAKNNQISMLFFWPALQQQIRIEGNCVKVDEAMSDAYFQSRPRASKVGAWASHQSEVLDSRETLENRVHEYADLYSDDVPRPQHWGGYALIANRVEFWQGRPSRLHDRFLFIKTDENWTVNRLNP